MKPRSHDLLPALRSRARVAASGAVHQTLVKQPCRGIVVTKALLPSRSPLFPFVSLSRVPTIAESPACLKTPRGISRPEKGCALVHTGRLAARRGRRLGRRSLSNPVPASIADSYLSTSRRAPPRPSTGYVERRRVDRRICRGTPPAPSVRLGPRSASLGCASCVPESSRCTADRLSRGGGLSNDAPRRWHAQPPALLPPRFRRDLLPHTVDSQVCGTPLLSSIPNPSKDDTFARVGRAPSEHRRSVGIRVVCEALEGAADYAIHPAKPVAGRPENGR